MLHLVAAFFILAPLAHGQVHNGGGGTIETAPGGGGPTGPGGGGTIDPKDPTEPGGGSNCDRPNNAYVEYFKLNINGPTTACAPYSTTYSTQGSYGVTPAPNTSVDVRIILNIYRSTSGGNYLVAGPLNGSPYPLSVGSTTSTTWLPIQFSGTLPNLQTGDYYGYVSVQSVAVAPTAIGYPPARAAIPNPTALLLP